MSGKQNILDYPPTPKPLVAVLITLVAQWVPALTDPQKYSPALGLPE